MSTDIMQFTFFPKNAQFLYEKSVILSGFWTARNIFFIVQAGEQAEKSPEPKKYPLYLAVKFETEQMIFKGIEMKKNVFVH